MCALGQPAHTPVRRTEAELPSTPNSSMSPPSAWMNGRTRERTDSTRALVTMPSSGATDVPPVRRCESTRSDRLFELELLDAVADLVAVQAEHAGGLGLVPSAPFERLDHQRAFELLEIDARRRQVDLFGQARGGGRSHREVRKRQPVA